MARQIIGVGAVANDGTGDPERSAWIKANANFAELYADLLASHPHYLSGNWYNPYPNAAVAAGNNGAGFLNLEPFAVMEPITISALGIRVATLSAGGLVMAGIYAHSYTTGQPTGNVLASVVGLSTSAATTVSAALGANVMLPAALYWRAVQPDNGTAALQAIAATQSNTGALVGSTSLANVSSGTTNARITRAVANTYGTFPDLTGVSAAEGTAASGGIVYIRIA